MSRLAQNLLLVGVLALMALGFAYLYSLRIERGDVFPAYSSLRSDPLGTRALYDSLEELPGIRIDRRFQPLKDLAAGSPRTILVAGMSPSQWTALSGRDFAALDGAVRSGSRLVLALQADFAGDKKSRIDDDDDEDLPPSDKEKVKEKENADPSKMKKPPAPPRDPPAPRARRDFVIPAAGDIDASVDLKRLWGIDLQKLARINYDKGAALEASSPRDLPAKLRWESDSYFNVSTGAPWRVIYRSLGKPVVLEAQFGRGTIVVAADSYLLSNEGLLNDRSTHLLSWLIGPNDRVEFDESHLGVIEDVGIAALGRRYGLAYAAGTLLLLAVLFIWKRTALFVPPLDEEAGAALDCSHTAALEALLLRSVPAAELISACANEWRATAPALSKSRLEAVLGAVGRDKSTEAYNAAVRALRRK
jgi:uncharacterized protein DUF4350